MASAPRHSSDRVRLLAPLRPRKNVIAVGRNYQDHAKEFSDSGFDASEKLVQGLEGGHIDALVVQDPMGIGYLAVKTMAAHLRGQPVEKRIDTGATLVTKATLADPKVQALLAPDLAPYLGQ